MSDAHQVLLEATMAATQAGRDAARDLAHETRPGVVLEVDPTNTIAIVQADGPEGDVSGGHGAAIVAPVTLRIGDRVMLLFTGTSPKCFVIGRLSGDWDPWHIVDNEGEPQFMNGWGNSAGTTFPGQNGRAQVMFTMRSGRVELRGQCERASGGADIFTLPEYAWPENDLLLSAQGALGAHINVTIESTTGVIAVSSGNVVVFDGISFLARIQQPVE
jgi:hypothetical protein